MYDFNFTILEGRLVGDAEKKQLNESEGVVVSFTLAVNKKFTNSKGEEINKAFFFPMAVFGCYADKIHPYLKKGKSILVQGELSQSVWEKDGKKNYTTKVVAKEIKLLGGNKNEDSIPQGPIYDDDYEIAGYTEEGASF